MKGMVGKKELIMDWYRVFGWHNNPFEFEILEPIEDYFVGYDAVRQKINYFLIENHRFGTIAADSGNGNTMLLTWLRRQLRKYPNKVTADYFVGEGNDFLENVAWSLLNVREKAYVKSLVYSPLRQGVSYIRAKMRSTGHSLFEIFTLVRKKTHSADEMSLLLDFIKKKAKKKKLVILIDGVDYLSDNNLRFLKMLLFNHFPVQVIAAGTPSGIQKSHVKSFGEKDSLNLRLKPLSFSEFKEMIEKRISFYGGQSIYPFTDDQLEKLYSKANHNIKRALNLCADVAIRLALKQKKSAKARKIAPQSFSMPKMRSEKPDNSGELAAFEDGVDINKIIHSVGAKKESDRGYKIKSVSREAGDYTIKELGSDRAYTVKEKKKKAVHHKSPHKKVVHKKKHKK